MNRSQSQHGTTKPRAKAELQLEGQTVLLEKGDSWIIPKGSQHTYKVLEAFTAVPLMLAVSSAVLVTYLLEPRSIYTARIAPRRSAAGQPPAGATIGGHAMSDDYVTVSAATPLARVLRTMLTQSEEHPRRCMS